MFFRTEYKPCNIFYCYLKCFRKAAITEQLPKDATVKAGEKLCLSCKADGFPLPEGK